MKMKKLFMGLLVTAFLAVSSVASAASFYDLDNSQKQKYWSLMRSDCMQLLKDKNYYEYRTCALDALEEAANYQPVVQAWCEDSDGKDFFNKGVVKTDIHPEGIEDYTYTFSNGKSYVMEGACNGNKYFYYQKNCAELGSETGDGACKEANNAPVFNYNPTDYNIFDLYASSNESWNNTIYFSASDPDGDSLEFYSNNLPEGATFDNATPAGGPLDPDSENAAFQWSPTDDQVGTYQITLHVSDGQDEATHDITVIVHPTVTVNVCSDFTKTAVYTEVVEQTVACLTFNGLQSEDVIVDKLVIEQIQNADVDGIMFELAHDEYGTLDYAVMENGKLNFDNVNVTIEANSSFDFDIIAVEELPEVTVNEYIILAVNSWTSKLENSQGDELKANMLSNNGVKVLAPTALTRAEFAKILVEKLELETMECEIYSDVPLGAWYNEYICSMTAHGYMNGYETGSFEPANTVNRAEAAKIIHDAFEFPYDQNVEDMHSDVEIDSWYYVYINVLSVNGVFDGDVEAGDYFKPAESITNFSLATWMENL